MTSDSSTISPLIRAQAPLILAEIRKASSILLHCHPSPDPDSVGSALAMKLALEQMGKRATVIRGDSNIPQAFMHFPGAKDIVPKSFGEIDLKQFDLFICLDSGTTDRIGRAFPRDRSTLPFKVINIDHHISNKGFGDIDLIASDYPATAEILFDLFHEWGVELTHDIAANLFIGIYTDTGGLKFANTNAHSYRAMAVLVEKATDFQMLIDTMENARKPGTLAYIGLGLTNIETFFGGKLAISAISLSLLEQKGISIDDREGVHIANFLRSVEGWDIDVEMVELAPDQIKLSIRTRDSEKYDVSKLAVAFDGGGHKAAAGAGLKDTSLDDAKKLVVAKAKELYNL